VLLPMRKFLFCISALIMGINGGLVWAQDAYSGNPYERQYPNRQYTLMDHQTNGSLRWRPLDEDTSVESGREPVHAVGPYPGVRDYTDEPLGLPRGTYRRIEERHTITPQLEGYRFRPIDPSEQLRNRSRNETQEQTQRGHTAAPSNRTIIVPPYAYDRSGQVPALNYRPDPRLDKDSTETPTRYAYPMGSEAPLFRPR
jgi:hypothetical protein